MLVVLVADKTDNPVLGTAIEQIVDSLPTAVFVYDVEEDGGYRLVALNRFHRETSGLEGAIGKRVEEFLPPEVAEDVQTKYNRCLAAGHQISYQELLELPSGPIWWRTSLTPVFDAEGKIRRLVGSAVDITAQKHAEMRLEDANRTLDEAINIIAHDLKQPLRAIRYSVAFALEDHGEGLAEGLRGRINKVDTLAVRGLGLIENLTIYGRLATEGFRRKTIDPHELLDEVLLAFAEEIETTGATVTIVGKLPELYVDATLITSVFTNLIGNAFKYSDGAPQVTIGFDPENAEYWVADRGIGIAPRHQEQVFRLFRRLHKPGARGGGDGMGLALVTKIVRRHGGKVRLASELGEGTTVYFHLPGPEVDVAT